MRDEPPPSGEVEDHVIGLSRRRFLVFGAAAAGLLGTAYATVRQVGCYPEPPATYRFLTPKEAAVFALLGDYMIPPGGDIPGSAGDLETLRRIDDVLGGVPLYKRRLLRALPQVFEHGSGLDRFGARSMTKLPADKVEEYLAQWEHSRAIVRMQLWAALKLFYGLAYFERPDVLEAIGMPIQCGGVERWP